MLVQKKFLAGRKKSSRFFQKPMVLVTIILNNSNTTNMNQFLSDQTNQAEALASIADSLSAISCCMQWTTVILGGYLLFRVVQWFLDS